MKRILAAIDGSDFGEKALRFSAYLASRLDIELLIVHVATNHPLSESEKAMIQTEYPEAFSSHSTSAESEEVPGTGGSILSNLMRAAENAATARTLVADRLLASAETAARAAGARNVHTILSHGDPARSILIAAKDNHVDLIVIGSRGFGELKSILLGSVSNKVTHLAECAVTTVR